MTCVGVMRSRMIPNVIYMCLVLNGFHIVAEPPLAERGCAPAAGLCGQHWADGHADCARPAVPRQLCGRLPAGCAHLSGSCAECCLPLGELLFTLWDCASPSASYSLRHMQSCWVSSILIHEALTRTEMHDHCYVCALLVACPVLTCMSVRFWHPGQSLMVTFACRVSSSATHVPALRQHSCTHLRLSEGMGALACTAAPTALRSTQV